MLVSKIVTSLTPQADEAYVLVRTIITVSFKNPDSHLLLIFFVIVELNPNNSNK